MSISQPWARVDEPVKIPEPIRADTYLGLTASQIGEVIRSHVFPRGQGGDYRRRWDGLWDLVRQDDEIANHFLDVLDDFIDLTEQALETGDLDERQTRRAQKYLKAFSDRYGWIDSDNTEPLQWAGRALRRQPPKARRVIETLVFAIDDHRQSAEQRGEGYDHQLWDVLSRLKLDPREQGVDHSK